MTTPTWAGGSTPEARPTTRSPPHLRLTRRIHTRGDGNKAASITGRCVEISSIMCLELGDGGRHGEAQRRERGRHDGPELGDGGMLLWWKTVPCHTTCSSMRTVARRRERRQRALLPLAMERASACLGDGWRRQLGVSRRVFFKDLIWKLLENTGHGDSLT
jgi:hypothetical protein